MEAFYKMFNLQLVLFSITIVEIVCRKLKIITKEGQDSLSNLLLNFVLPCSIIASFSSGIDGGEMAHNLILALILSCIIQGLAIVFGGKVFKKFPKNKRNAMHYGMICSNSSFIGMPVAENIYGSLGVIYVSIFQIPVRVTMWTSGLSLFTSVDKKSAVKSIVIHPCMIAMYIGLFIMFLSPPIPEFLSTTITYLSNCTIPLSMLVIGSILSECKVTEIFDKSALYFSLIRLIVFPLIILVVLKLLHIDSTIIGVTVIMSGMPAGSTTAILADKYDGDGQYASKMVFVSTLFSMITVPLLCAFI